MQEGRGGEEKAERGEGRTMTGPRPVYIVAQRQIVGDERVPQSTPSGAPLLPTRPLAFFFHPSSFVSSDSRL